MEKVMVRTNVVRCSIPTAELLNWTCLRWTLHS